MLNNCFISKNRGWGYRLQLIYILLSIFVLLLLGNRMVLADDVSVSDGNDDFRFNAFIREKDVIDGTPDWDNNDEPGNDSGPKNGVVRTFDTVTYPLKVTINPKKTKTLRNIQLKITGKLHDGFKDGRAVGAFAVGSKTEMKDAKNGDVMFEQQYTMKSSGNAVMIPVTVEVQGARPGQEIYPDYIKVEVVCVDGEKIENVSVTFNQLKRIRVSAKVNVGVKVRAGFMNINNRLFYQKFNPNVSKEDTRVMHQMYFSVNAIPVNGRTSMKGSTFPDGKIKFHIDTYGDVTFDGHEELNRTLKQEELPKFFDHFAFYGQDYRNFIPQDNTWAKENVETYQMIDSRGTYYFDLAKSKIVNYLDENRIKTESFKSVWDSGVYKTAKPTMKDKEMNITGEISDYVIGTTFPEYRADGWTGWKVYTANESSFSTHAFLFLSDNLFEHRSESNPNELTNTVNYRFKVTIDSYFDKDGNEIPLNAVGYTSSNERNEFGDGYDLISRFFAEDGSLIGSPHLGWNWVPEGDEVVFENTNAVRFSFAYYVNRSVYGGMKRFVKWNVDSFEMTKDLARKSINETRSYKDLYWTWHYIADTKQFLFGVPKYADMSFKALGSYGKEDYEWYTDIDEALSKGKIGAMLIDINDFLMRGQWSDLYNIYLKPLSHKIGSENEKGTHNVAMFEPYFYPDKERKIEQHIKEGYVNPTIYNDDGSIQKLQNPVSGSIGFDTLGILNARTTVSLKSDKDSYYLSEEQNWHLDTSITFATGIENFLRNQNVTLKTYLSKALSYKKQSVFYEKDGKKFYVEPKITLDKSGNQILSWDYLLSGNIYVPTIHFKTEVIPLKLDSGVVVSQSVKSVIESDIDKRRENLRTTTKDLTILKVGQVGVAESIDKSFGDKNSDYTLHLRPFTTIEDEYGVKGLTHVPSNDDSYGSKFHGTTYLKEARVISDKPLNLYVNLQHVDVKDPNQVDVTKDGWMAYDESVRKGVLNKTKSIYFVISGVLSNKDAPMIDLTFGTSGNDFHDIYYNEVIANSDTRYPVSPISNKVSYEIKAQLELALRKIQIYTDQAKNGLPVNVYLNKDLVEEIGKDLTFKVNLYRKDTNELVDSKTFKGSDDVSVVKMKIPENKLVKDDFHMYEVRIEGYNTNRIYVLKDKDKVSTEGYTSAEKVIKAENEDLNYKGVVMTGREVGFDMMKYYETIHVPAKKLPKAKTGYGYDLPKYEVMYKNELGYTDERTQDYKPELLVNGKLMDKTMKVRNKNVYNVIELEEIQNVDSANSDSGKMFKYQLPEVGIHENDGLSYDKQEILKLPEEKQREYLDGGRKLYIPIWLNQLGNYDIHFGGENRLGVNQVQLDLKQDIDVYAYMYEASRSESIADDEVMLKPQMQAVK